MTEQYVAATFTKDVDFSNLDDVERTIRWCRQQFQGREA
jgi:hypothetical protein